MKYLIDTNCLIYLTSVTYPQLNSRIEGLSFGDVGISAITFAELFLGAEQGKPPLTNLIEAFVEQMPLLSFDEAAARCYGRLPFRRNSLDRLLAAHALSLGLTILSRNVRDFEDIRGLEVEDWTR